MDEGKYLKVLNTLQARCSRSECCSRDMRTKALKALDGDEEAADRIVASLVADKFVNDLLSKISSMLSVLLAIYTAAFSFG